MLKLGGRVRAVSAFLIMCKTRCLLVSAHFRGRDGKGIGKYSVGPNKQGSGLIPRQLKHVLHMINLEHHLFGQQAD